MKNIRIFMLVMMAVTSAINAFLGLPFIVREIVTYQPAPDVIKITVVTSAIITILSIVLYCLAEKELQRRQRLHPYRAYEG